MIMPLPKKKNEQRNAPMYGKMGDSHKIWESSLKKGKLSMHDKVAIFLCMIDCTVSAFQ